MPAPSLPARGAGRELPPSSPLSPRRVTLLALPLLATHAGLLWIGDLAGRLEAALALWALAFAGLAWAIRRLGRGAPTRAAVWAVLAVALLLRLLLLPLQPTLSTDSDRYLWDGHVLAAGFNPYLLPPAAPELAPLRSDAGEVAELWERLDHKEVPTVYPPLALGLFTLVWAFPSPLLAWKLILVAADLAACGWLVSLSRRQGAGRESSTADLGAVAAYAWNPLVVLEGAGMGHVDALAVAATIGTALALTRATAGVWGPARAGAAAAAGILAKLGPLAALPAWAAWLGSGKADARGSLAKRPALLFLTIAGALTVLGLAPVLVATGGVPPGLVTYGVAWEFNGPLYEPLHRGLEALGADHWLARRLDGVKELSGHHEFWNRFYPWIYPQLLAKLVLGLGMLTVVALSWRTAARSPASQAGLATLGRCLFGGLLLCSATVYPWYLLWVLPWAALGRRWAWLLLSATLLLAYVPQFSSADLFPWIFLAIWTPPLLWSLATR